MFRITFAISILVAVVVGVAFAACGDTEEEVGTEASPEEYFLQLQERFDSWAEANLELVSEFPDNLSDEERVSAGFDFYQRQVDLTQDLARELAAMTPPPSLVNLHSDLVSTADDSADTFAVWVDWVRLLDPEDREGARSAPKSAELKEAGDRFGRACLALEDASADTLNCSPFESVCNALEDESSGRFRCPDEQESSDVKDSLIDIAPGIIGRLRDVPPLPDGLETLTQYMEFEVDQPDTQAVMGMPLKEPVEDAADLGWYSYENGEWKRLDVAVLLVQAGTTAEGDFEAIPASLVVLREK